MRAVDVLREVNRAGKPEPMIAGRINVALIRAHWSDILRIIASFRTGTVTASLIMRQPALILTAQRRRSRVARVGPAGERTLFTLDWVNDPALRRKAGEELNKGESRNSLARAVFLHRLGEIRDRTYENQQHRASGLNLLVTQSSCGTRGIWNAPSPPCGRQRSSPIICWLTCPRSDRSTSI
jgi:TnpA family transposase